MQSYSQLICAICAKLVAEDMGAWRSVLCVLSPMCMLEVACAHNAQPLRRACKRGRLKGTLLAPRADPQDRKREERFAPCQQGPIRQQDVLKRRLRCACPVSWLGGFCGNVHVCFVHVRH